MEKETLKFPKIPKDFEASQEVKDMALGKFPDDFDYDQEVDKMYLERAGFKGDWAEGKTAVEYANELRSTRTFTRTVDTW